jgi:hypothetical protein
MTFRALHTPPPPTDGPTRLNSDMASMFEQKNLMTDISSPRGELASTGHRDCPWLTSQEREGKVTVYRD